MPDHDPLCPQHNQTQQSIVMFDTPCRCEEYARVRAACSEECGYEH